MTQEQLMRLGVGCILGILFCFRGYSEGGDGIVSNEIEIPSSYSIPESPDTPDVRELWYLRNGERVAIAREGVFYRLAYSTNPFEKTFSYGDSLFRGYSRETINPELGLVIALETVREEVAAPESESGEILSRDLVTIDYKTGEKKIAAHLSKRLPGGLNLGTYRDSICLVCRTQDGVGMIHEFKTRPDAIQTEPLSIWTFRVDMTPNRPLITAIDRTSGDLFWVRQGVEESAEGFDEVVMRSSRDSGYRESTLVGGVAGGGYIKDIDVSQESEELAILAFQDGVYRLYRQPLGSSEPQTRVVKSGETVWRPDKVRYGDEGNLWIHGDLRPTGGMVKILGTQPYRSMWLGFVDPGAER